MSKFVVLKSFYHRHEAEMARGLLEEAGIPANIQSDDAGGYYPHLNLSTGNVRLLVPADQLAAANDTIAVLEN